MIEGIGIVLMLLGAGFVLVAGIGVVRLPDVFMRMHASTKAGTLGVALIAFSAICFFDTLSVAARAIALVFFVLLTAPVAAHMIGRAAYRSGAELWEGTFIDEWFEYEKEHPEQMRANQTRRVIKQPAGSSDDSSENAPG